MSANARPPTPLPEQVRVVNLGLELFGDAVRAQGAEAVDVDWRIPAGGDPRLVAALTRLHGEHAAGIADANAEVVRRLDTGDPVVTGVQAAGEAVPGMGERMVLHAGPALAWERFCDPLRRSVRAAVMAEGWASSREEADRLVSDGQVALAPANAHATVLPMATALGPSAPVWMVDNPQGGTRAFSGINQGPGQVAWFGVDSDEAVQRLVWLRDVAAGVLDTATRAAGDVAVFNLAAQGLQMGDDLHMRVQATTNILIRHLLPHLMAHGGEDGRQVAAFLSRNHLFFLNLAMAAAKAVADWAAQVEGSSVVVGMARNGTTFGIRLAGMPDRWFVTDAPLVDDELYHGSYTREDAAPDIGDSAVLELVGLGGAAAAASPAVAGFLGNTFDEAVATTQAVARISVGRSTRFQLPYLGFRGTPLGVDVRAVTELETTPSINTGILHASAGVGQIGAGIARAPRACFAEALLALDHALSG